MNFLVNLIPQDFPAFLDALRDTLVEAFLADFLGAFFLEDFLTALRERFLALFLLPLALGAGGTCPLLKTSVKCSINSCFLAL